MTIRYLDLLNGNDSNNGSSFALRKKTWASVMSGLVATDAVRVMASPVPTSMAQNATFTNSSDVVTLTTAVTANVDPCEYPWTASANVTASAQSATSREGTNAASLAIASGFTTGLVAYSRPITTPPGHSISNRASNVLGAGTLTMIQNASADDTNISIALPFSVTFNGTSYSTVYVGSNGYLTFGAGASVFSALSASNPAIPGIMINAADRSYQRVYAGSEDSNVTFRIRYEGSATSSGTPGSSTVFWEVTFTAATPGVIKIDMGSNAASASGTSGVSDGAGVFLETFASGTVNTGYTLTFTAAVYATLDLSGYKQISLLIRTNAALAASVLSLNLCSDSAGATPVNTVAIPAIAAGQWAAVVVDTGAALGSSIQSVSLTAASDPGTITVYLDNIIACKDSTAADSLTHRSLISKSSGASGIEPWLMIRSINGTTIKLGAGSVANQAASYANFYPYYYGATATQTIYKREPILITAAVTSIVSAVEGGWDATAMTTQSSQTYLLQQDATLKVIDAGTTSSRSINKIYAVNGSYGIYVNTGWSIGEIGAIGCQYGLVVYQQNGLADWMDASYRTFTHCGNALYPTSGQADIRIRADTMWGFLGPLATLASPWTYPAVYDTGQAGYGVKLLLVGADIQGHHAAFGYQYGGSSGSAYNSVTLSGCTVQNCYADLLYAGPPVFNAINCSLTSLHPSVMPVTNYSEVNIGGDTTSHKWAPQQYALYRGVWTSDATVRHTAADFSWKLTIPVVSVAYNTTSPVGISVAKIACVANEQRTVALWFYRDNIGTLMRLIVKGGQLTGISSDVATNMTAAINTWQQLTVQFTPTQQGVVEVFAECYGSAASTLSNTWIDDLGVS